MIVLLACLALGRLPAGNAAQVSVAPGATAERAGGCTAEPSFDDSVTPPSELIPGYPNAEATTAQINAYVERIDAESDRVSAAQYGRSVSGTPLLYALAGDPADVADPDAVAAEQQRLRLGAADTGRAEAEAIAEDSPAIAWYAGNVHGDEPSGGDAALEILYEIAAREDCAAQEIRDELLTGIIPTQNPDGRDDDRRSNDNGFDLNRDWFAQTQPETEAKIDLLREFPPLVYVDAHEMGGRGFFFPPNADPVHHEISPQSVDWINKLYAGANRRAFRSRQSADREDFDFFNYDIYDLLYMGYGDTVPTTAWTAAGMTYEKGGADSARQRWLEQRVAGWTTLSTAADNKRSILLSYWRAHRDALAEGRAGRLEPNRVFQPGAEVERRVPDLRIRNYFFSPSNFPDASELVERLRDVDVDVYRLTAPLETRGLRRYGRSARSGTLPAGTYWVPMDQVQKRWVQAILGQDSYVPFPYFYDVTAWSNPLLMNLDAWFTATPVDPEAVAVATAPVGSVAGAGAPDYATIDGRSPRQVAAALRLAREGYEVERLGGGSSDPSRGDFVIDLGSQGSAGLGDVAADFRTRVRLEQGTPPAGEPVGEPRVAVLRSEQESAKQLRFSLDASWQLPYDEVSGEQIAAGTLESGGYDVLIVPGVGTGSLDAAGAAIRRWVKAGGRYVGTGGAGGSGGTAYAISRRLTSARASRPEKLTVPGTMFRVTADRSSTLTLGSPESAFAFHLGEDVLRPGRSSAAALRYPRSGTEFFTSGYAEGQEVLRGTAALVEERFGDGNVVLFSGEPNFRAYTEGMSLFLMNAIAAPARGQTGAADASAARFGAERRAAAASLPKEIGPGRPLEIEVANADAEAARATLEALGAESIRESDSGAGTRFEIPNARGLDADAHPFAREVVPALEARGVTVLSAVL